MIVVTGGSGFIGSHVIDKLIESGYKVRVIDINPPHRNDVDFGKIDILDFNEILKHTVDAEYIFHLAAVSNVNVAFENPILTVKLNSEATVNILEAARQNNVKRVFFASTVWVYGGARDIDVHEDSPFHMPGAGHIYTSTKIASELYCHDYWELYNVPFTIMRYGIPYGPRARVGTVIPIFIKRALAGEPIIIFGDGSQYRNFIYVEDLADGNVACLSERAKNQTYNLEGNRPISIKEVAETIQKLIENVSIEYKPARPGDYKGKVVSTEKVKKELGWETKISFEEGMDKYIKWFKENIG